MRMAKNTHSQEVLTGTSDSYTDHELNDPNIPINRPTLGEVDNPSAPIQEEDGIRSSQSLRNGETPSDSETVSRPSPAQTMESPSSTTAVANSSADSMGGLGQEAGQNQSGDEEIPPYDQWTVESLREECRTRGLIVSGNKSDLVNRLEADDDESESEDSDDFSS
jgi:hypothetical protein